jgi:alpha-beta hydrolase superfamily lysophospholipase
MNNESYWKVYYDEETLSRSEALRQEFCVETADNITLHVDAYLRPDPSAPVILLTHGTGQYARMLMNPALALYDHGYSVLVLDQRGHGFSTGKEDFTLPQLAQDILDASHWARRTFQGPLFLGGINEGGALVYLASTLGAPVVGLISHQLADFSRPEDVLGQSRLSGVTRIPGGVAMVGAAARTLMAVSPRMRLSYNRLASFEGFLDERDNGRFEAWQEDPLPARTVTMRYALSALETEVAVPYEENMLPMLVINPMRDRMSDPQVTQRNFERLGGPKNYVEIDYGHWSMLPGFAKEWAALIDPWVRGVLGI